MSETVYAAIDLELTGLKVGSAEIIEVGVVRCTPERVLERWSALARPYGELPLRIERLTGITPEMLRDAPPFEALADELRALLEGTIPLGHNVKFDIDHLGANGVDLPRQAVDTLPLAQVLDPAAPSHRLGELCERHGIALDGSHRALADAEASRRLLLAMRQRWDALNPSQREYAALANGAMGLASPLRGFLSLVSDGALPPRRREPRRAAPPKSDARAPEPPPIVDLPERSLAELTAAAFDAAAGDAESGMERRESQRAMALDVARALDNGEQALVEAGTGVGKSLAYLVPAALWAMREGKRVLVSTHTRNLQAQLSEDDFGLLRRMLNHAAPALGPKLRATTLKGRGNYLCRRALETTLARGLPVDGEAAAAELNEGMLLARAGVWAENADCRGDREQLRLPAEFNDAWARLSAERASCLHDGTDHVAAGACFLARAFDAAAGAHITVVNHAWLISNLDAARRYRLDNDADEDFQHLAESDAVIVDEAHFLEDATTNALRQSVNGDALEKLFDGIRSTDRRHRATLTRRAEEAAPVAAERLADATLAAREAVEAAWFAFEQFLSQFGQSDAVVLSGGMRAQPDWEQVERLADTARKSLRGLASELRELARAVEGEERGQLADDARATADICDEAVEALQLAIEADPAQTVAWLEKQRRQRRAPEIVSLDSAPIDVSGKLTELLWSRCPRVVLTGATLTVDGQWGFLRRRLGMPEAIESRYDSPFDYERNARIYIAGDMPPLTDPPREVEQELGDAILALARAAEGRTLALFTAHGTMRRVMERVRQPLANSGIALSVQGPDGSPAQVVDDLRGNPRTVIFGVDSLWTGIDVPGEALSQVIVCRLPFDRPNDPIQSARAEQYENAFVELSVPTAILKLRQGVGRLIRTGEDRGVIIILDNRVATKRYGARFLNELPPAPIDESPIQRIAAEVRAFLPPLPPL